MNKISQEAVLNKIFKKNRGKELVFFQIQLLAIDNNISSNQANLHVSCEKLHRSGEIQKRPVRGEKFVLKIKGKQIEKIIRRGYAYLYK